MRLRLKDLREDNDLSQKKISEILYISQVTYSYYEIGKRGIPIEILCRTDEKKPYAACKKEKM